MFPCHISLFSPNKEDLGLKVLEMIVGSYATAFMNESDFQLVTMNNHVYKTY